MIRYIRGQLQTIALSRLLTGAPGELVLTLRNQLSASLSSGFSQPVRTFSSRNPFSAEANFRLTPFHQRFIRYAF
ncbi:hypothetical protein [Paenibacillus albidus]|uniref:hypothetical protein n=1 Tax=Paenibacillus albidus TaxID=2041023 RepID=UPI0016689612|nr:hypothetical protein [Paenibacillus albidus]